MAIDVNRRQFLKRTAAGLGSSSAAMLGFAPGPALAQVRAYKLTRATEVRNTCPSCSVGCGLLMYSLGDRAKNAKPEIMVPLIGTVEVDRIGDEVHGAVRVIEDGEVGCQ